MGVDLYGQISGLSPDMFESLVGHAGYPPSCWGVHSDCITIPGVRWYQHQDHLRTLSAEFPEAKIEAFFENENGEKWMVYAFGGQIEVCDSIETFEPRTLW